MHYNQPPSQNRDPFVLQVQGIKEEIYICVKAIIYASWLKLSGILLNTIKYHDIFEANYIHMMGEKRAETQRIAVEPTGPTIAQSIH